MLNEVRIFFLESEVHEQDLGAEAPEGAHEPAHPSVPRALAGSRASVRPCSPKQLLAPTRRAGKGSPTSCARPAPSPEPRRTEQPVAERRHDILFLGPAAPLAPLLILSFPGC